MRSVATLSQIKDFAIRIQAVVTIAIVVSIGAPCGRAEQGAPVTGAEARPRSVPSPGTPAPLFSAERLDGGSLSLKSLRGHVVLLNFWAVNCPPCRIEMPELEQIHRRYRGRGLRVIGVTEMDPTRDQARRFIEEAGVTYPILLDPGARIGDLYALEAHPTTLVIDADGRVRFLNAGYLKGEETEIERAVLEALGAGYGRR